jgi:signal transduction histidine kinase
LRDPLAKQRLEVEESRASRRRLVLAADADRRRIERELHDGPQQDLVALAVNLQLARRLVDVDPAAALALLDEIRRDVHEALDGARQLASRVYPPLLETGGLGVALRSAAAVLGVPVYVHVPVGTAWPPEIAGTVYFCCVEVLERLGAGARATVTVREEGGELAFEILNEAADSGVTMADAPLARLRDRVEALGGRLTLASGSGRGTRISGSLPLVG